MKWESIDDFGCDIIDSRDIIARIDELEAREDDEDWPLDDDEGEELALLREFAAETEPYCPDWRHGATLISDSYFVRYAQEFADDIGAVDAQAGWPNSHINWEAAADDLKQDYTEVSINGYDYWVR